jgi:parallel beta-helix repeat protein
VYVAAGTYELSATISINGKDIALMGADSATTIIDGKDTYRVISVQNCSADAYIGGFTIRNGRADSGAGMYISQAAVRVYGCVFTNNTTTGSDGAGILNDYSSATITSCTFTNNSSAQHGGGMYNYAGSPTLLYCNFMGNTAAQDGGALGIFSSSTSMTVCIFFGNSATYGGAVCNRYNNQSFYGCFFSGNTATDGGAVYNYGSYSPYQTCTFSGNTASRNGGGLHDCLAGSHVAGCTFSGNNAAADGGAIYYDSSDSTILGSQITGNAASSQGGGICVWYDSSPSITGCTISANNAPMGAGIYNAGNPPSLPSEPIITNCVIYGNYASNGSSSDGGGIYNERSSPIITNCTLYKNTATGDGPAVYNWQSSPLITNCIIWGDGTGHVYDASSSPALTYCDIRGGYAGEGNIDEDPLFFDALSGYFMLTEDSPCIDAGRNAGSLYFGGVTDDIMGYERPQGVAYDMGAYEYEIDSVLVSPASMRPLVTTALAKANAVWQCIAPYFSDCEDAEVLALMDQVQAHMQHAASIGNPIAASGELAKALGIMNELSARLSCPCAVQ